MTGAVPLAQLHYFHFTTIFALIYKNPFDCFFAREVEKSPSEPQMVLLDVGNAKFSLLLSLF